LRDVALVTVLLSIFKRFTQSKPDLHMSNKQPYTQDFYDVHADGSLRSARVILSELFLLCDLPQAVVDVGCGTGTWLLAAREKGVTEFFGLDGDWVSPGQLKIPPECYVACDISAGPLVLASLPRKRFDLVISVEVAEHLPPNKASQFISLLCELGDLILFSAAIPGQPGENHINGAWPAQWAELFADHNFFCFDVLRSRVWMNPDVDWWYAQNVLIFASSESKTYSRLSQIAAAVKTPFPIVHPKLFNKALREAGESKRRTSALLASRSWRVTAPLRRIADALRKNRLSGG
jgi:SAM-dependent methyltransferase